jgi:hypothetical protein
VTSFPLPAVGSSLSAALTATIPIAATRPTMINPPTASTQLIRLPRCATMAA